MELNNGHFDGKYYNIIMRLKDMDTEVQSLVHFAQIMNVFYRLFQYFMTVTFSCGRFSITHKPPTNYENARLT